MSKKPVDAGSPPLASPSAPLTPHIGTSPSSPLSLSTKATRRLSDPLKELRSPTFREHYPSLADQMVRESRSPSQNLTERATRECQTRNHSRIQWQWYNLGDATFLDRRENVPAFGKPCSRKTHLLSALGVQWGRQGRAVLFTTGSFLVQELLAARRELKLSRVMKILTGFEALIIDDLGYVQQSCQDMEVSTLLAERYERGSVLPTSNLPFSPREQIFKDPTTAAAKLNIRSYRLETAHNPQKSTSKTHFRTQESHDKSNCR